MRDLTKASIMEELNPLYQLDVVLRFIKNKNNPPKSKIGEITKGVFNELGLHELVILQIVNKLIKDGYVDYDERNINSHYPPSFNAPVDIVRDYFVTFEGNFFLLKPGGYVRQEVLDLSENRQLEKLENAQKVSRNQMNFLTGVIAVGTLVAAIYYGIEIYKEFHLFFHHIGRYWIWETIPKQTK